LTSAKDAIFCAAAWLVTERSGRAGAGRRRQAATLDNVDGMAVPADVGLAVPADVVVVYGMALVDAVADRPVDVGTAGSFTTQNKSCMCTITLIAQLHWFELTAACMSTICKDPVYWNHQL